MKRERLINMTQGNPTPILLLFTIPMLIGNLFQQAYGIDLYADKSLHILRFRALLQAIPKSTRLSEIIGIRAAKIPAPNKHNQEQIAELMRLKSLYALRGSGASLQEGLGRLFQLLKSGAKNG